MTGGFGNDKIGGKMMPEKSRWVWQSFIISLVFLILGVGCAKKPTETPFPKINPETSITGITITGEMTKIYANAVDPDGIIEAYKFRIDGGKWTDWQTSSNYEVSIIYSNADEEHTIEVVAKDNDNLEDPTPANLVFTPNKIGVNDKPPKTNIIAPVSGARTSGGVIVNWEGSDPDGSVAGYAYKVDDGDWVAVEGKTTSASITSLSAGGHTILVKARDNIGVFDPTPASVSFFVQPSGTFHPELSFTEGPSDGATFFVARGSTADFTVAWQGDANFYYGAVEGYSYTFQNETKDYSGDLTGTVLKSLGEGTYTLTVRARDINGNVIEKKLSFEIVTPTLDHGILVANGLNWGAYAQATPMYEALVPIGLKTMWDWFKDHSDYPAGITVVGKGNLTGTELGKYSTLIWVGGFDEDFAANQSLIKSYIQAGGKFMMQGHNLSTYLDKDFIGNFAHIKFSVTADVPVNASNMMIALESGLVDMGPGNGSSSSTLSDLMVLDKSGLSEGIFAYGSKSGELIGIKSRVKAGGSYQIVLIGARPFRMDLEAMQTNYTYILKNILGEKLAKRAYIGHARR